MNGQWLGTYIGSNAGDIIVNLDDRGSYFEGLAYLNDVDPKRPSLAAYLRTVDKSIQFQFTSDYLQPINPTNGMPDIWSNVERYFPGIIVPKIAQISGLLEGNLLHLNWVTDINTLNRPGFGGGRLV